MKTMALDIEAFHHAAAAHDIERAERLIERKGIPLHFRGAMAPVLNWLESLPLTVLDARPSLWVTYAWALLFVGQHTAVEQKLQAAEAALQGAEPDDRTQDLVGRIASMRATLAVIQHDVETIDCPVTPCPGVSTPPTTCLSALPLPGRWGMPLTPRKTILRPAGPIPKSYLSVSRLGIPSTP